MTSLRRRLTVTISLALFVGGLAAAVGLYLQAIEEINEQFDVQLPAISNNIAAEALLNLDRSVLSGVEEDDEIVVQLWSADGQLRYHSDAVLAPFPKWLRKIETLPAQDDDWISYSRPLSDGRVLQVAQSASERHEMAAESAFSLLLPLLIIMPLLAGVVTLILSRELKPLRQLSRHLERRAAEDDTPVNVIDLSSELTPVVESLNQLFARQAAAATRQRVFLAEAAHELRTPIAVVKLQAQLVRQAKSPEQQQQALRVLDSGIERLNNLGTQLLALARSESQTVDTHRKEVLQLDHKLREWLAVLYPLAHEKQLDLGLLQADACQVAGDANGLESLVTNLLQNAIAYTPSNGRIDVTLTAEAEHVLLAVSDTGCGIQLEDREKMFERFVRGPQAAATGSGLGLAIVREQAARHGGSVELAGNATGQGLTARVTLPRWVA